MSMQRGARMPRSRGSTRSGGTFAPAALAAVLALSVAGVLRAPLDAQEATSRSGDRSLRVTVFTEGTYASYDPRAYVELSEPAHLAVFEVEPGVGALRLYPAGSGVEERFAAGRHSFALNGIRVATLRRQFRDHLGRWLRVRVGHYPDAYLVAVASGRPFRLEGLASGRIYDYRDGPDAVGFDASAGTVAAALLEEILVEPGAGGWDYDLHAYSKMRSGALASTYGASSAAIGDLAAFNCLASGTSSAIFVGYGTFRSWSLGVGPAPYGFGRGVDLTWAAHDLPIAISPVSRGACESSSYLYRRYRYGFPRVPTPIVLGPAGPTPAPGDTAREGEPGELDPTGITVGEPQPPPLARGVSAETRRALERAEGRSLLERVADARSDGGVTSEQVREMIHEGPRSLPRSLPETMELEAFRRHRVAEREARIERQRRMEMLERRQWRRHGDAPAPGSRSGDGADRSRPASGSQPAASGSSGTKAVLPPHEPPRPRPARPSGGGDRPKQDPPKR